MVETGLFYALGALLIVSAWLVISVKNVFHSALFLALALLGVAGLYILLQAYFLAGIQVLIYIGAVVTLAIFVISMTHKISGSYAAGHNRHILAAVLAGSVTSALIIGAVAKTGWGRLSLAGAATDGLPLLGRNLLQDFVLPFELVSALLLAALLGAIVIVSRKGEAGQ